MRCLTWKFLLMLIIGTSFAAASLSASPSLSVGFTVGTPGSTAQVAVNYTTDTNAAALNFDLVYDTNYLTSGTPVRGNALSDHWVASSEPWPGVRRVVVFSAANSRITNGVLVYVPFTIVGNAPDHDEAMALSNVVVANLQADAVPVKTTNGVLAVAALPRFISISPTNGGAIHLELVGPPGHRFLIEGTRTVGQPNWTYLYTNVANDGVIKFDDLDAASLSSRFYRAQLVP